MKRKRQNVVDLNLTSEVQQLSFDSRDFVDWLWIFFYIYSPKISQISIRSINSFDNNDVYFIFRMTSIVHRRTQTTLRRRLRFRNKTKQLRFSQAPIQPPESWRESVNVTKYPATTCLLRSTARVNQRESLNLI